MGYFDSDRIQEIELNLSRAETYDEYLILNRLLSIEQYREECNETFLSIAYQCRSLYRDSSKCERRNKLTFKVQKQLTIIQAPAVVNISLTRAWSDDILDTGIFYVGQDI